MSHDRMELKNFIINQSFQVIFLFKFRVTTQFKVGRLLGSNFKNSYLALCQSFCEFALFYKYLNKVYRCYML